MLTKKIICFIFIVSFLFSCQTFSKKTLPRHITWSFNLQPYKNSKIYINHKQIHPKVLKKDKSLGMLQYTFNTQILPLKNTITIIHKSFAPFKLQIKLKDIESRLPKTIFLNQKKNIASFYKYYSTGKQPKSIQFIDNEHVVIALLNDTFIHIVNIHTGKQLKIKPKKFYSKKEGFVESISFPKRNEVWVSQMPTAGVHIINTKQKLWKRFIPVKGRWSKVLLKHPRKNLVYLSNWLSKNISIIDTRTYKEVQTIPVYGTPRGMYIPKKANSLYVALYGKNTDTDRRGTLIKVNLKTNKIIAQYGTPGAKRHLTFNSDKDLLYMSDMSKNYISVFDINHEQILKRIPVYSHPNTIVYSKKNKFLFVSCRGPNGPQGYLHRGNYFGRLLIIDTKKHEIVEQWEAGNQPTGLDVAPNGKYLATTDFLDDKIRIYEINK